MTSYVLLMSVGPVQGFISAARRSRDLWSGSWMLSELAKSCAKHLHDAGCEMIFPYIEDAQELLKPEFSVGNKIQVVVQNCTDEQVRTLAANAAAQTRQRFRELAQEARASLGNTPLRDNIWNAQIDDYLEIQSAWAEIGSNGYLDAAQKATQALAARKATRDFQPSPLSAQNESFMLPKSSLDGARETVLPEHSKAARTKLRLAESEQLDCAGVAKRAGAPKLAEQFTPFSRVAADAWVETLDEQDLDELCAAYELLVRAELATRVRGNAGIYGRLPYDAQLCYPFRLDAARRDAQGNAEHSELLSNLMHVLKPIWRKYGQPCAYGVLLLADGDFMGKLIDKAKTQQDHQNITKQLSAFAQSVPEIVRKYRGHTLYAGGDDVLAFVPLHQSVACAEALSEDFQTSLAVIAKELDATAPTLSVGLAIAHIVEPLGQTRDLAQRAEKAAKGDGYLEHERRNALGIALDVRGGNETLLRLRWDDQAGRQAFRDMVKAYMDKTLPSRVAYDVRSLHQQTVFALAEKDGIGAKIQQAELKRMFDKARTREGKMISTEHVQALTHRAKRGLNRLADELIVARWLSAKVQSDLGEDGAV